VKVLIKRIDTSARYGTFGEVSIDGVPFCKSVERPMAGDHPCILVGSYKVIPVDYGPEYQKPGRFYTVQGLESQHRDHILIHSANWFEQLLGCIALGADITDVSGEYEGKTINHKGVTSSRATVEAFQHHLGFEPFDLEIVWAPGIGPVVQ